MEINSKNYTANSRPWWMDRAYVSPYRERPIVARVEATREDGLQCMLELTEDDLTLTGQPGVLNFPLVVDGPRPSTNQVAKPLTYAQVERAYAALQSEGYNDPELEDRTPWQKGDDLPY